MSESNSLVAVYASRSAADAGTAELRRAGFNLRNLSIAEKSNSAGVTPGLPAPTFIHFSDIGSILIAGPLAELILANVHGETPEIHLLSAVLYSLGIPMSTITRYESSLQVDKVLLLANGEPEELMRAKDVLRSSRPDEVDVHFTEEAVSAHL